MKEEKSLVVWEVALLTAVALMAFAGNSVLCRLALRGDLIGADAFTAVRVTTGALALWAFLAFRGGGGKVWREGSWRGGGFLVLYMVAFSWGYLGLETGPGALILFGAVQLTMVGWAAVKGERPRALQLVGLVVALGGLAWLLLAPGTQAPPLVAGGLMALSGVAWGAYTLCGKGAGDPLRKTAGNFLKAAPVSLLILAWAWGAQQWSGQGVLLAMVSGVVTSAAGYAIWYHVLRSLSATRAASLQLLVPVLAAMGGLVFGGEALSARLVLASVLVLGGVGLVLRGKPS